MCAGGPSCDDVPVTLALLLASASLYVAGYRRMGRSAATFGRGRLGAFLSGMLLLAIALVPPLERAADLSFTAHVAQHLLLSLFAPPLIALGAPVTLALRAGPPGLARSITRVLRTRPVTVLTNPIVGWMLFVVTPFVYHLTWLFDGAIRSTPAHIVEHAVLLGSALIYWWPIVGVDPSPHPVSYPARILSLFLAMPAMTFLALAIYLAGTPLYASYLDVAGTSVASVLADQRAGAVTMWLVGNLWMVITMLFVTAGWKRHDDAVQHRLEARVARSAPRGSIGA
jgi:putative copper resistance protein D